MFKEKAVEDGCIFFLFPSTSCCLPLIVGALNLGLNLYTSLESK